MSSIKVTLRHLIGNCAFYYDSYFKKSKGLRVTVDNQYDIIWQLKY